MTAPTITEKRCIIGPVVYKIDVLAALKEKGYSTYKLRNGELLPIDTRCPMWLSELQAYLNQ